MRHGITHRRIEAEVWRGDLAAPVARSARACFVDPARPAVGLTAMAKKVMEQACEF